MGPLIYGVIGAGVEAATGVGKGLLKKITGSKKTATRKKTSSAKKRKPAAKKRTTTAKKRSVSVKSATKGKCRLKKGYRYAKGGRIVKAKAKK